MCTRAMTASESYYYTMAAIERQQCAVRNEGERRRRGLTFCSLFCATSSDEFLDARNEVAIGRFVGNLYGS